MFVTVIGDVINQESSPKNGMLIDFGDLKKIIKTEIINEFDHAVMLNRAVPKELYIGMGQMLEKLRLVDYQPTCENMIADFAGRIRSKLPGGVKLFSLRLHETATSYAEWFDSDNI